MYVLLLLLVPVLYMYDTYAAMAGLVAAIYVMYKERTGPSKARTRRRPAEPIYKAGYED